MGLNDQTSVDEIKSRSDMVAMLDRTLEELDNNRAVFVFTISKGGSLNMSMAGFFSTLEMQGMKVSIPEMLECVMCKMDEEDEDEE